MFYYKWINKNKNQEIKMKYKNNLKFNPWFQLGGKGKYTVTWINSISMQHIQNVPLSDLAQTVQYSTAVQTLPLGSTLR
jgi:hypothetical protein